MKGRKPLPGVVHLLRGNPGKRPIKLDDFSPAVEVPRCPAHLDGEAKKEWRRISAELERYGLISGVDRAALAMYCTAWGRYVQAEAMIAEQAAASPKGAGLLIKSPNGFPVQSPWLSISNRAIEQCKALLAEFGMSPAMRSRVRATRPETPDMFEGTDHAKPSIGQFRA